MPMTANTFDKTHSARNRLPDLATPVDSVVIGACSPALLYGLEAMVAATPGLRLAGSAGTLNDFVDACSRAGTCIGLADCMLVKGGVIDLLDALADRTDQVRPVLMTQGIQPLWVREALKRGAFGFVRQSDGIELIRSALLSAAEGKRYIPGDIATQLADSFMLEDLTNREMQVLGLLSQGRCNKAIARDLEVALGTVKTHVSSIMCKLDVPSRMAAILEANRRGLITFG